MAAVAVHMEDQRRASGFFGVLRRPRTYLNLLYLALWFPLAYVYGAIFIELSNQAFGYGQFSAFVAFLLYVSLGTWALTFFERWLAHWLLGVRFSPMAPVTVGNPSLWERTLAHLRNPVTWKSLFYLVVRVVLGLIIPSLVGVLALIALVFLLAPALYIASVVAYSSGWLTDLLNSLDHGWRDSLTELLFTHGQFALAQILVSLVLCGLGILAFLLILYAINGVSFTWGRFAQAMLGISPKDAQLAEARAMAAAAQERAAQAEHGRRQLILDASHELRTPVATLRAHIDSLLLLEGEQLPEKVRAYLTITQRESVRLGVLLDDLLMLTRADSEALLLDIRSVPIDAVVEEVFQAMEPLAARERQVTLVRSVAEGLPNAYVDRDRLAQVLLNLVRNAITYTPAGGLVAIEAETGDQPERLTLIVTDTGIGIPEEDLEHIFERFYRTDASRARHTGGFGLGLSIARDLVEAMGGTLTAERVEAGGSRFRVTLRAATVE